jgi:hypothetical protein
MVLEIRLLAPEHAANHWPHQGLDQSSFDQPPLTCTNVPRVAANDVEESFREFGRRRGLFDAGGHSVEALTPLLTRAEGTALRPAVRGPLAGGGEALLGRLRGGVRHAAGAESDAHSESLVAITRVPESEPIVSRLFCWRRGRVEAISGMGLPTVATWAYSRVFRCVLAPLVRGRR